MSKKDKTDIVHLSMDDHDDKYCGSVFNKHTPTVFITVYICVTKTCYVSRFSPNLQLYGLGLEIWHSVFGRGYTHYWTIYILTIYRVIFFTGTLTKSSKYRKVNLG